MPSLRARLRRAFAGRSARGPCFRRRPWRRRPGPPGPGGSPRHRASLPSAAGGSGSCSEGPATPRGRVRCPRARPPSRRFLDAVPVLRSAPVQ
ncbi:MAG: hypothetical protein GEU80_08915 [Dehalococcoidia bacterium]|nr:hypothetical protein [Dehalococcoidia bacterium]